MNLQLSLRLKNVRRQTSSIVVQKTGPTLRYEKASIDVIFRGRMRDSCQRGYEVPLRNLV